MYSLILSTANRFLLPLLLLFSIFLFLRGHNEPGGGFVGGLVAAAAYSLYAIAFGTKEAFRLLGTHSRNLISIGLLIAFGSVVAPLFTGQPLMKALWFGELPVLGKLGTPLLFDFGVYLVVLGVSLTIIFSLAED